MGTEKQRNTWGGFDEIIQEYRLRATETSDELVLTDHERGKSIVIAKEEYFSSPEKTIAFVRYTVAFSTQHRHFEQLEEARQYVCSILRDAVLPIEFYRDGKRCFGGEITRDEVDKLTADLLSALFGYSGEDLKAYEYEIHSWSGKYDVSRRKVNEIDR